MICDQCKRRLRPYKTKKEDHPGTVARGGMNVCMTCAARRGKVYRERNAAPAAPVEQPIVPVRSMLRPSTYRALRAMADRAGVDEVADLLSQIADRVVQGAKR
jgi:hypothetical protein